MDQVLDYVPTIPKMRRRRWFIRLAMLLAIVTSIILAIPQYRSFQHRQNRRAAIRQQFSTQLASAQRWLNSKSVDDAALALLQGEFPTHTESNLFWRSELDSFDRQITSTRQRMFKVQAQREAELEAARKEQERRNEIDARNGREVVMVRGCSFPEARIRTLESLNRRAIELLKARNNAQALPLCLQIVALDPMHEFDKSFWANIPK